MTTAIELLERVIANLNERDLNLFFRKTSVNYAESSESLAEYCDSLFTNIQKLGEFRFENTDRLVVIISKVAGGLSERTGKRLQYDSAKKILRGLGGLDSGIFIFYDDALCFRMSLLYTQYIGTRKIHNSYKRHTYYVSPGEPHRTFLERIGNCDFEGLDRVKDAFSVEKVTKDFYTEYDRIFKVVENLIQGFGNSSDDSERKRLYTQTLFNRLMFIAFVEKKGWLKYDGQIDYLLSLWKGYKKNTSKETNFYRDRLKLLFFVGLNTTNDVNIVDINKNGVLNTLIGEVPYLNGGLFEENTDDTDENIIVPDRCFVSIIDDLFKRFNFTVTENTPLDVEVAVDPEMLGKVFEELVTSRQKTGSYYTPKTVVSFMCREALKGYLGGYEKLVDDHDVNNISVSEGRTLIQKLKNITVCDPACGSGAYLVGMLHELQNLQHLLDTRVAEVSARDDYQLKLDIIRDNLYGVDVDSFAVNIARLRLWLSLAVEYEGDKPEPLPNLDFKIEIGDSLSSPDPQGGLEQGFRTELINQFREKKELYLSVHEPGPKHALREHILNLRKQIMEWTYPGEDVLEFDWAVDFVEVFSKGGFDIAIANPPYGLTCEEPLRFQYFPRSQGEDPQSKDSYGLFMARALQLLKSGGFFTFIVSDTWRTIRSHRPLRRKLLQEATVEHFIDLPSWIFQATVNTCILSLRKQIPKDGHTLVAVDLRNLPNNDWQGLEANFYATATHIPDIQTTTYARYTYPQDLISTHPSILFFIGSSNLFKLLTDGRYTKLGTIAEIKVGLQTGDNEYYISKRQDAHGSYAILKDNLLLTEHEISKLSSDEKSAGLTPSKYGGRYFVPYDKGGESDSEEGWLPNYYVPTNYFITWSKDAVRRLKTATLADVKKRKKQPEKIRSGDNNKLAAYIRNQEYYFRYGVTFSRTGYYAPTFRLGSGGVFDTEGPHIFTEQLPPLVLISLLASTLSRYIMKVMIDHTVHFQVDEVKELAIPREINVVTMARISGIVDNLVRKQQTDTRYPFWLYEQKELDSIIYDLFGLSFEDIREIELWYCRRYPKLAKAQGLLEEVENKYASYLRRCELIMSKHPDYWRLHPILQLISQCEGPSLEFKETLEADATDGQRNQGVLVSSLKTIAAFLNTSGGTLLIGVSDRGEVKGIEKDFQLCKKHDKDGFEQKIRSLLHDRFQPNPIGKVIVVFENLPEGDICRIDVQSSAEIFYLDGKDVYIRDGNTTRKLEGPSLVSWLHSRSKAD